MNTLSGISSKLHKWWGRKGSMDWQSKLSAHSSEEVDWWGRGGFWHLVYLVWCTLYKLQPRNGLFLRGGGWGLVNGEGCSILLMTVPCPAKLPTGASVTGSHGTLCEYTLAHRSAIFLYSWDDSLVGQLTKSTFAEFEGLLFSSYELQ